jgi:hypothetical protein
MPNQVRDWMREAAEQIRRCCLNQDGYLNAAVAARIIADHAPGAEPLPCAEDDEDDDEFPDCAESIAAIAYQICGALGAPARILDYFSAVASGKRPSNPLPFCQAEPLPAVSSASRPYEVGESERRKDPQPAELVKAMIEAQEDGRAAVSPTQHKYDLSAIASEIQLEIQDGSSISQEFRDIVKVLERHFGTVSPEPSTAKEEFK